MWEAIPSEPPWKGTVNFNWSAVGPVTPSVLIEALNEPTHKLELGWPLKVSTLNAPAQLFSAVNGSGFRKFLLSNSLSSAFHPR